MTRPRRESPIRRTLPSGKKKWVARYTNAQGERKSAGQYDKKKQAQAAIDAAYGQAERASHDTIAGYLPLWLRIHPRSQRTNDTNRHRVERALGILVEGRPLRDWPLVDLRRRHTHILIDNLLRKQRRSARGATHILRALSAMLEDAIGDDLAEANPFRGVTVRASDERVTKPPKSIRVWTWAQMHGFARAARAAWVQEHPRHPEYAPVAEAIVRTASDTGLRLGELLPLYRSDLAGSVFTVQRTAYEGRIMEGTKTDHGETAPGRKVAVPEAASAMLHALPPRIDTPLMFPTPSGKVWRARNFYRDLWHPARDVAGIDPTPHEFRHSFISLLLADGIDPADLGAITGHTPATMHGTYHHALNRSAERIRELVPA